MLYYIIKVITSALLIVLISEISKRSTFIGGLLASIPLISILAFIWLYIDTNESEKIIDLAYSIFWLVLPSLVLFITLPIMLRKNIGFEVAMASSIIFTLIAYGIGIWAAQTIGNVS